jgi:hypothetical protein
MSSEHSSTNSPENPSKNLQTIHSNQPSSDFSTIEIEAQAATFRKLVTHLQSHTDVQNIDLMNLAHFCRNCLSKWMRAELIERGIEVSDPQAREIVYGQPYDEWKKLYQKP